MPSIIIADGICQEMIKEHTCISLTECIHEGGVLFNQIAFHFDFIIVNDLQTPHGSQT